MVFDGPNKLVILSSSTLNLQGLWSEWKDWLLAGNAQYALAFDTVGGEPIDPTAGTMVPLYLFVLNGWKIRPMEADHTLNVTNGTLVVSGGGDPFVSTLGDYTVRIRYQQPVQAIGYSTSGVAAVDYDQIAAAIRSELAYEMARLLDLAKINGLVPGVPATVTETSRTAGDVAQTISESGGAVTVIRA